MEGRQPSLYTRRVEALHASDPLPFPTPSSWVRLLHQLSLARLGSHHCLQPPTGFHRLPPPRAPVGRTPTASTAFRHLARLWAVTVSPSPVSNSVETSTGLTPLPHPRVRVPACGDIFSGRCRLLGARCYTPDRRNTFHSITGTATGRILTPRLDLLPYLRLDQLGQPQNETHCKFPRARNEFPNRWN